MESNQDGLKALLQEKDCVGVPANEEYQEYLAAKKEGGKSRLPFQQKLKLT